MTADSARPAFVPSGSSARADSGAASVADGIVAAERRWFEIGAKVSSVGGADVCVTPGYEPHPAAAGALMRAVEGFPGLKWLRVLEQAFTLAGYATVRLHAAPEQTELAARLRLLGYRSIVRTGYRFPRSIAGAVQDVHLRRVTSLAEWDEVEGVHDRAVRRDDRATVPDEARRSGRLSVALARFRSETAPDDVSCHLIERDDAVVGSVVTVSVPGVLAVRNLVVAESERRRSAATGAVARLVEQAQRADQTAAGLVQAATPTFALCGSLGAEPVLDIVEHHRTLD